MSRSGWSAEENEILRSCVEDALERRGSLSAAFRETAGRTGRKPNSVRNHYYNERAGCRGSAGFKPFSEEESEELVEKMLALTEKGYSVRGAALKLASGDAAMMLRYQNKFRALREKRPELFKGAPLPSFGNKASSPTQRGLEAEIKEKNRELALQHDRFTMLHAMFTKLCEMNRELAGQLAEKSINEADAKK